jgi:A/G-specific adenine glycosylase
MWEGLGYYRRARNLLASSKLLVKKYNSKLPKTLNEIKKLPGVGDYTANALMGFIYNEPTLAIDGNVKRVFSRFLNKKEMKINFEQLILINKKNLFVTNRNSDFIEAIMEFGALICKPKDPKCSQCCLNKSCRYLKSPNKIKINKRKKIKIMNYNVFCYVNKKKQIALTKENKISFLKNFNLPLMKKMKNNSVNENWRFLKNYKNSISNLSLNINLYYKFSNKIPKSYNWYSLNNNKELIPSFTKKIFNQVSILF